MTARRARSAFVSPWVLSRKSIGHRPHLERRHRGTLDNGANPAIAVRNALPQRWLAAIGLVPYEMGETLRPRAARDLLSRTGFSVLHETTIMHSPRVLTVPWARLVDRLAKDRLTGDRYLGQLERFEIAERWPTRRLTGHFVAFLAQKP